MTKRTPLQRKSVNGTYAWPDNYYLEGNAAKRLELLRENEPTEDPETIARMKQLFSARYTQNKDGSYGDNFLFNFVQLKMTAENLDNLFGQKQRRRQALKNLNQMCLGAGCGYPEDMLYMEMCQLTAFFISTCSVDKNYTSVLWGLGRVKDDAMRSKISRDLDLVGTALPEYLKLEEECRILSQAIKDTKEDFL